MLQENNPKQFLKVVEIFESIQGETSLSGIRTTFLRLSGCNLNCHWCDTKSIVNNFILLDLESITQKLISFDNKHICITGGEPLLQPLVFKIIHNLKDKYNISIETNGTVDISNIPPEVKVILDVKTISSGHHQKHLFENLNKLKTSDEVKFVIQDKNDYEYAKNICQKHNLLKQDFTILFSPVHNILHPKDLVQWIIKDNIPVRLNLQTHKYIWGEDVHGV